MPAPLSVERMKEIARVVASSPTMAGAAVTLGYSSRGSLATVISQREGLKQLIAAERKRRVVDTRKRVQ